MLKQLTDNYYRLSTEAEELLQHAITEIHEERTLSEEETLKISTALAGLQTAYSMVRKYTSQKISDEDMPEESAPVSTYVAIIHNKRMITEEILKEFLLSYTENERFTGVLKETQEKAQQILDDFREDMSFEPDVMPYKAFIDSIKMGRDLDSEQGDKLLEIVSAFNDKLARGLQWGHFLLKNDKPSNEENNEQPVIEDYTEARLQYEREDVPEMHRQMSKKNEDAQEDEKTEKEDSEAIDGETKMGLSERTSIHAKTEESEQLEEGETEKKSVGAEEFESEQLGEQHIKDDETERTEEKTGKAEVPEAEKTEEEHLTEKSAEVKIVDAEELGAEQVEEKPAEEKQNGTAAPEGELLEAENSEVEYVAALNHKENTTLPSSKKLKDAFSNIMGSLLLDALGLVHLISKELIEVCPVTKSNHFDSTPFLETFENKGYLEVYEVDGKAYYCPSQMFADCIQKPKRAKILQEIRNRIIPRNSSNRWKPVSAPLLIGTEKLNKKTLLGYISWLNVCISILKIDMPMDFKWDQTECVYRVSGSGEAKNSIFTDVIFVTPEKYADWMADKEQSVCTYGDVLPDSNAMQDAMAKHCFYYTDGLYHWEFGKWKAFDWRTPPEDGNDDPVSEKQDEETELNDSHETSEAQIAVEGKTEECMAEDKMPQGVEIESMDDKGADVFCVDSVEKAERVESIQQEDDCVKEPPVKNAPKGVQNAVSDEETVSNRKCREDLAATIRESGSAERREHFLKLAYKAYAAGRRGIGGTLMRALAEMHPEVHDQWNKWACASGDPAYSDGRNATRLQAIYHDANFSELADSALAIASYIRMYFSNDAAKEYWVRSADAVAETKVLKEMGSLRELMQRLQNYVNTNQYGINQATLIAMRQEFGIEDQFEQLKSKADDLLKARLTETTVSNPRVKNLFEILFGNNSFMIEALQCICGDKKNEAGRIRNELEEIDPGLLKNSQQAIEGWMELLWDNSTKKLKGKNANDNFKGSARNSAVNRTKNALGVINQWIELCIHNDELPEETIIIAAAEVNYLTQIILDAIQEVHEYKAELRDDLPGYGALMILEDTLTYFCGLMRGETNTEPDKAFNAEVAACSAMAVEEDGTVYIIPAEDMTVPYEQCVIIEDILKQEAVTIEDAALYFVENSMANIDPDGGNFSNGRYLLKCTPQMDQTSLFTDYSEEDYAGKIKDASSIVVMEERKFHAHMEMAQSYGWFNSYIEQERIERAVAAQCEMYRILNDFSACVECMKRTFNWCRQTARTVNHDRLMADLDDIVKSYDVEKNNATLVRIKKLIDQDCYTAATTEIRKIYKDGCVEEQYNVATEGKFEFFIQNFQSYYAAVSNVNKGLEGIFNSRNNHNHKGYVSSGREMLRTWPQSPEAIHPQSVENILTRLNLDVDSVTADGKSSEGHAMVKFKPRTSMDFAHPIADFGTSMIEGGLDVFYMGGNKTAEQYFNIICAQIGKGTGHSAIFFVNSAMPLSVRRQLTSKIWHELRSSRPMIILDRVLALYVAESEKIDRWNILLQCALPFAMIKPYTENKEEQQPPEMFVGRVRELRKLTSFGRDGANLVYGGRQLGKSAILYRVEQELHNEKESTYVVVCAIKDKDAEEAVPHILLAMRRKNVPEAENISLEATWADMCLQINLILTEHPVMKLMLLIDEADILLGKDRETSYAALSEIKRVQDAFRDRFKFVFAGLHNVMRLHNEALNNNSDLPKLGSVNIKPLDYADAEKLLKEPLSYMGFMFNDSEEQQALISMILSTTNYYPGLIHYYCASLLNTFSDGHTEPAPIKPPYELDHKLILNLLQKKDFLEQTKQKVMMTLGIDEDEHQYYSILAYLMAYCYDENGSRVDGVSIDEIREAAEIEGISVISRLEASQVETLLDELCELNILYCAHGTQEKHYVFSRPAFKDMLGTQDDVIEELLRYTDIKEVSQ